ncbi:E3 ubiquitin-protein ligase TRIM56-like [Ptychodera flava]|uniref:E3 ubiquitin-protein ligase TRIM56-like n=1 Tax=Ptychodera flava TaxID=63121 RepID=UPI003969FE86
MAMASSVSSEKVLTDISEQILLCAICMERFKSPKILPCYHTYCEPCLTEWVKTNNDQLICPTCKELFPLPSGGVPAIDNNRFINDLQQILSDVNPDSEKSLCDVCEKEATLWCQDCGEFFCDDCVKPHKRMRLLKEHKLMTVDEYTEKMSSEHFRLIQPRFCDKHSSTQLEFYCDSCQVPTCYKCTVVEHVPPEHVTISVEAALEKYMPTMKEYEEKAAQKVSDLKQARDGVLDVGKCLEKNKTTTESQIRDLSKTVIDEIKKQENRLLTEVADTYSPKRKQIDSKVEQLEHRLVGVESMHSHLNHLLRYGGAVDIMAAKTEICLRLQQDDMTQEGSDDIDSNIVFTENPPCRLVDLGCVGSKVIHSDVSCFSEVSAKFHLNHVQLTEKEAQYVLEEVANETGVGGTCNSDGSVVVRGSLVQIAMVEERLRLMKEAKTSCKGKWQVLANLPILVNSKIVQ